MFKFLFISVKPEFANQLVNGTKTIELRKNKPKVNEGDFVIIYSTVPVKSVLGFAKLNRVIESSPTKIWNEHSKHLGIDKARFESYYENTERAIGLEISPVCKLTKPIKLSEIKKQISNFSPPQTYRYFSAFSALKLYSSIIRS